MRGILRIKGGKNLDESRRKRACKSPLWSYMHELRKGN